MTGFVQEHLRPLIGSAGLHLLLLALAAGVALRWTSSQPPVQLAIEGVVVDAKDLPKSARSGPVLPVQQPKPKPTPEPAARNPPPQPAADPQARQREAEAAAAKQEAARERAQQEKARAEAARRKAEETEAQKRKAAEAEAQKRKAAEAEALRKKDEQAKAAADAKAKAAREADLQRRLAAEEEEGAAMARAGVVDEYRALLVQTIERNWIRPPAARAGLSCTLYVTQATGGTVLDVKIGPCNGDQAVRESIVNAVYRASPLPAPRDTRAFERRLEIVFRPTE